MKISKSIIHATSDSGQDKNVRVRVLGWETRSKSKLQCFSKADLHWKPTNAVAKHLGRQIGAEHRKYTRGQPNCLDLAIGDWNVLLRTEKEQELVWEAQHCRLDTVGISFTKRRDTGTVELNGGWKIFYLVVCSSRCCCYGLLMSPNIAECVVDWVPLGGKVCLLQLRLQERSML